MEMIFINIFFVIFFLIITIDNHFKNYFNRNIYNMNMLCTLSSILRLTKHHHALMEKMKWKYF